MPNRKLNLLVNAESLLALLQQIRGEPLSDRRPEELKAQLNELCVDAAAVAGTRLVPVCHDHEYGTSVFMVRQLCDREPALLKDDLSRYDGERFALEDCGREWIAAGDLEIVDVRSET